MNTYAIKQSTPLLNTRYVSKQQLSKVYTKIVSNIDSTSSALYTTISLTSGYLDGRITDVDTNLINTITTISSTLSTLISNTNRDLINLIDTTSSILTSTISLTSGYLDGRITDVDTNLTDIISTTSSTLSSTSDSKFSLVISAFCKYITGNGDTNTPSNFVEHYLPTDSNFIPKSYGYAYLDETNKVAALLIPDIAITDINVIDIKTLYNFLQAKGYLAHTGDFYTRIQSDPTNRTVIVDVVRDCIEAYIKEKQLDDSTTQIYGQGDVIVITYYNASEIDLDLVFANVFSQEYIAGAWMCSAETHDNVKNNSIEFVKISFNQGSVLSVNNIIPNAKGNVYLPLSAIYRVTGSTNTQLGEVLAGNLLKIKSTLDDTNAMANLPVGNKLVDILNIADRFIFDDDTHSSCYAYTTVNEFLNLSIAAETTRVALSSAIGNITSLNGNSIIDTLNNEITRSTSVDNYISGVIGNKIDLVGNSVIEALNAEISRATNKEDILDGNITTNTNNITILNGNDSTVGSVAYAIKALHNTLIPLIDAKVDKVAGKSLVDDTEIARLATIDNYNDSSIRQLISDNYDELIGKIDTKVDKVTGKSLVDDTEIARLAQLTQYNDNWIKDELSGKVSNRLMSSYIYNYTLTENTTYKLGEINDLNITTIPDSDYEILLIFTTDNDILPNQINFPADLLWINYTSVSFEPNKSYLVKIRNYIALSYELTTIS